MKYFKFFLLLVMFVGCDGKLDLTPKKIKWDRDICERCKMIVSDRNYAAQVIDPSNGKTYKFDDIGCAVLWFKDQNVSWKNEAVIYVVDVDTKEWIDARKAFWSNFNVTPMSYGFAAHSSLGKIPKDKECMKFSDIEQYVLKAGR